MSQKDIGNKIPIYKLKAGKEVENYYDEWTVKNKYDKDMVDWKYSGPQETVDIFKKHLSNKNIKILDAGCGTGLVGIELKKNSFTNIDGADFSQKMLDLVPGNIYQNLFKIDLNKEVNIKRTEEALETKPEIIAAGCPFCNTMLTDGIKNKKKENEVKVLDIAELINQASDL